MTKKLAPSIHQAPRASGFTLVELLVVIGIIAVLISMLLPALRKARESAQAAQCLSNIRQMGLAVQNYSSESKGFLPPYRLTSGPTWAPMPFYFQYLPGFYQRGLPGTMICPSDNLQEISTGTQLRGPYPRYKDGNFNDVYYSYALNYCLPKRVTPVYSSPPLAKVYWDQFNPSTMTPVKTPTECAVLLETYSTAAISFRTAFYDRRFFRFSHQGGRKMTVLMCDGHAEMKAPSEIMPGDPVTDTTQWPPGFRGFWFGRLDVDDQILLP